MKFQKSRLEPLTMTLGGNDYPVFLTNGGMMELEQLINKKFTEIFEMFASGNYGAKDLMSTTYVMLRGGKVEVTLEDLEHTEFNMGVIDILLAALNQYGKIESLMDAPEDSDIKKSKAK